MNRQYRETIDLHPQLACGGDDLLLPVDGDRLGEDSEEQTRVLELMRKVF